MKRIERLHALTEMLRRSGSRGCTAQRLATEFGVSVRTVKRDLDALERSGAPLWSRPGPHGGYGLTQQSQLPPVRLTSAQAVALLAAVSAAPDAPYSDLAAVAVRKIVEVLDPPTKAQVDALASRIWVNDTRSGTRAVRSALEEAMLEQRVVRIQYTAQHGNTTKREVEPMIFALRNEHWYLVAWCRMRAAVRWFRVNRIEGATVTQTSCVAREMSDIGVPPATSRPVGGDSE